jgi:hypothetical protein
VHARMQIAGLKYKGSEQSDPFSSQLFGHVEGRSRDEVWSTRIGSDCAAWKRSMRDRQRLEHRGASNRCSNARKYGWARSGSFGWRALAEGQDWSDVGLHWNHHTPIPVGALFLPKPYTADALVALLHRLAGALPKDEAIVTAGTN